MQGSFLSSTSTLGEALNLMSEPIDDVVGAHFDLDEEEKQLKHQLEADGSGPIQTLIQNMVFTRSIYPSWIFSHMIITPQHHNNGLCIYILYMYYNIYIYIYTLNIYIIYIYICIIYHIYI